MRKRNKATQTEKKKKNLIVVDMVTYVETPEDFPAMNFASLFTCQWSHQYEIFWKAPNSSLDPWTHQGACQIMELNTHLKKSASQMKQ